MRPVYLYQICDFAIASELALPHGLPASCEPSAWIRYQRVEADLGEGGERGFLVHAKPGLFLFEVVGVARFLVRKGEEILIDPVPDADEASIRAFLLTMALAALLTQRHFLVLNGGAVVRKGEAIALVGQAGGGRSAMLAEMQRQGFSLLSDEICAVKKLDGVMVAWPVYPALSLWEDLLTPRGIDTSQLQPVRACLRKFELPFERPATAAFPLTLVMELKARNRTFSLKVQEGNERLVFLLKHTRLTRFLSGLELGHLHLTQCLALISQAGLRTLVRPRGFLSEERLFEALMAGLRP